MNIKDLEVIYIGSLNSFSSFTINLRNHVIFQLMCNCNLDFWLRSVIACYTGKNRLSTLFQKQFSFQILGYCSYNILHIFYKVIDFNLLKLS